MKILVTGGTVFVSKFVAEYFSEKSNTVYVLNRNTRPQLTNVKLIECDRKEIGDKLKGLHFDTVIDVTAYTAEDINNLLNNIEIFDNYIMISSSAVYKETNKIPFKESAECGINKFRGDYGTNKLAAEKALINRVPNAYILRPPYLYGKYNNIYREAFVFDCAEKGLPFYIPQDGSMPLQFLNVIDLCRFIEIIIKLQPKQKIFNVGSKPITIKKWVEYCYSAVVKTPTYINITDNTMWRNYFPFYEYGYILDVSEQDKIMPNFIPFDVGIKQAYEWYKYNKDQVNTKNYFEYIEKNFK